MAQSLISPTLRYPEPPPAPPVLHPHDHHYRRCMVYEVPLALSGQTHRVVLGRVSFEHRAEHRLAFVRVYLLRGRRPVRFIGVYEVRESDLSSVILDSEQRVGPDGRDLGPYRLFDRDVEPLLFGSVTGEYLRRVAEEEEEEQAAAAAEDGEREQQPQQQQQPRGSSKRARRAEEPLNLGGPLAPSAPLDAAEASASASASASAAPAPDSRLTRSSGVFAVTTEAAAAALAGSGSGSGSGSKRKKGSSGGETTAALRAQVARDRAAYKPVETDNWVRRMLHSKAYTVRANEGAGDSLFLAVAAAYASEGLETSVATLRALLAQETTQADFEARRNRYLAANKATNKTAARLHDLKARYESAKARAKAEGGSSADRTANYHEARKLKTEFEKLHARGNVLKAQRDELAHMKDVSSLADFRALVQTREFAADAWVERKLERALRLKLVVLRRPQQLGNDDAAGDAAALTALQCGGGGEDQGADVDEAEPLHFVILELSEAAEGSGGGRRLYQLVAAADRVLFTFAQLPAGVKTLLVDRCREQGDDDAAEGGANDGDEEGDKKQQEQQRGFMRVAAVRELVQQEREADGSGSGSSSKLAAAAAAAAPSSKKKSSSSSSSKTAADESGMMDVVAAPPPPPLFAPGGARLCLNPRVEHVAPGKVVGERVTAEQRAELAALPEHWRRMLSDAWTEAPFSVPGADDGGLRWASVTHYLVAAPLRAAGNERAYAALSLGAAGAAAATKMARKTSAALGAVTATDDARGVYQNDYERGLPASDLDALRAAALAAKVAQNGDVRAALMQTGDAELAIAVKGKEPVSDVALMRLRAEIREGGQ